MRLTRRGKIVRALVIGAGFALVFWLSGRIWWTDEGRFCWGTLSSCVGL